MKIMILGADGYLGWVNLLHFACEGHEVIAFDNKIKRQLMFESNVVALEIESDILSKLSRLEKHSSVNVKFFDNNITHEKILRKVIKEHQPDTIIHFAEQPSAPYSMANEDQGCSTIMNNYMSTLRLIYAVRDIKPDTHIIKLGTMGEYGTPDIDIEEGWININHNKRQQRMLYPKSPHSIYHLSKVNDSDALAFACKMWNLTVTDLNQGFVYGVYTPETESTGLYPRYCYDHIFGTVFNRFIVQHVLNQNLTVYGEGNQIRPMISILDSVKCVHLATVNPPKPGDFRVLNQFTETTTIKALAYKITKNHKKIEYLKNPRIEEQDHYYNPKNKGFSDLGLLPSLLSDDVISKMIKWVKLRENLIFSQQIYPLIDWVKQ